MPCHVALCSLLDRAGDGVPGAHDQALCELIDPAHAAYNPDYLSLLQRPGPKPARTNRPWTAGVPHPAWLNRWP